jgi:membrane protein YqaA with SNARE-associated domain
MTVPVEAAAPPHEAAGPTTKRSPMPVLEAYVTVFLAAFLAATIVPVYSEVVLGALVATQRYDIALLVLVATAGNVLGSTVNRAIGRFFLHWRNRPWFPFSPARIDRVSAWFRRYGVWSLLFAWTPFLGDPLTFVAGFLRVPILPFLILVTIGKALRYVVIAYGTELAIDAELIERMIPGWE